MPSRPEQLIDDRDAALAVLHDPRFVVPPLPPGAPGSAATTGIGWLRAHVGRFSTGASHLRRRALSVAVLAAVPAESLRHGAAAHPVATLGAAMGVAGQLVAPVRAVAQAYQPGTGDDGPADAAVERLVRIFGGVADEATAARIGVLVQACDATAVLIERARHRPVAEVLHDTPPVPVTRRTALVTTTVGDVVVPAGDVVRVGLAGGPAFGAGPRRCPGRAHALALALGARA